jgi:general secretion pathway protein D
MSLRLGDLEGDDSDVTGLGTRPIDGGNWTWGRMTIGEVSLLLDLLMTSGRSKLISNPRVTTLSNEKAEIEVSTTIPVETLNRFSEGGIIQDIVSFQDLDVSINLSVTPRVADDSTITLEVVSNVEEITGYVGPEENRRPVTSRRSVVSSVTVKSNESLGLGGLMKEVEHKTVKKFPILGSIPLIGLIFQHHVVKKERADLLILITPRIVEPSLAGR